MRCSADDGPGAFSNDHSVNLADGPRDVIDLIEAGRDREAAERGAARPSTRDGATVDPITQLEQLGPHLGAVVAGITTDQLGNPTPCDEFTVRGVLEHMIGGATAFAAAYRGEAPTEPDLRDPLDSFGPVLGDLVAAISAPGALDRTVQAPFGEVPGDVFARYVVLDGLVHGWDLATATGQSYEPPEDLIDAADAYARQTIDPLRDGKTFADAVEPVASASPIERLANYTGRRR
jgi:uncharacterized protein (TIGR03086 family)